MFFFFALLKKWVLYSQGYLTHQLKWLPDCLVFDGFQNFFLFEPLSNKIPKIQNAVKNEGGPAAQEMWDSCQRVPSAHTRNIYMCTFYCSSGTSEVSCISSKLWISQQNANLFKEIKFTRKQMCIIS